MVTEDLTCVTYGTDDPKYRGRTFNHLTNHGARGRYASTASNKLEWQAIPELVVPSFHTSVTDHRHGIVDAAQRKGERFEARHDGLRLRADEHASHTIALWLLLKPPAKAAMTIVQLVTNATPVGSPA